MQRAIRSYYLKNSPEANRHNTVIYGGGLGCRMYISSLYSSHRFSRPFEILGIVDEDPSLQNLNVYGFRVLGTSENLESLYDKKPFDVMVLTTVNIPAEIMDRIRSFADKHNVRLTMFLSQEYPADPDLLRLLHEKAINLLPDEDAAKQADTKPEP